MKRRSVLPWLLSGGLAFALFSSLGHRASGTPEPTAAPVLQRLQALGELHTARFEYADVVDHASYQEPQGLLAAVPGAVAVARATTENKALLNVRGSVEAGVDLKKLQAQATPTGLRIVLPAPHAYRPDVDAKLFSAKRGLFWRDDAVALDAVEEAKARLVTAARCQGLLKNARDQAIERVRALAESFGAKVADVRIAEV